MDNSMKIYHLPSSGKYPEYFANIREIEGGRFRLAICRNNGQRHNGLGYGSPVCDVFHVMDYPKRAQAIAGLNVLYPEYNERFNGKLYVMARTYNQDLGLTGSA